MRPDSARLRLVLGPAVLLTCITFPPIAAQQKQLPPTFRSGVEVVRIDVSVVDKSGRPVNDLTAADFTVTVDRKPRAIVSAQFLKYETGTTTKKDNVQAQPVPAPAPASQVPPPPRIVLIVIDEDHIESVEGLAIRKQVARFLDLLAPNDRIGVVTIPRLREEVTLSTRRSDVIKSLEAVTTGLNDDVYEFHIGTAEAFAVEKGEADVAAEMIRRNCGSGGGADCKGRVMMVARQVALQAHLRSQRSLDALASLAEGLAGVEGPKTMLLISGGLPMPDQHSLAAFNKLESTFAAAQISLYTLYMEWSPFGRPRYRPSPTAEQDIAAESWGLENATSVVGGTLMPGVGTLEQYFDRVVTELSGAYLLGVEVTAADRDGRTHLVEVKVNRRGVDVRARKRYLIERERLDRVAASPPPAAPKIAKVVVAEPPPPNPSEALTLDVVALDRGGRFVESLRPEDLAVTVDGAPRRVVSMRLVSRGPGANASASLKAAAAGPVGAAAEDSRTVLVVIDEVMLDRAGLQAASTAAVAFVDRLGPNDRVAVVRIPQAGTSLTFTTERPTLREALRGVGASEASSAGLTPVNQLIPGGDLERMSMTLHGLAELFGRLEEIPGRKAVALFSAGLPAPWLQLASEAAAPENEKLTVESVAQRAAASRVTVYGVGVRERQPEGRPGPDLAPVEAIARETGGQYVALDAFEKSLGRLVSALSACYRIEIEGAPESQSGRPSRVEVKTPRKDTTLESASWAVSGPPPDDRLVPAPLADAHDAAAAPNDSDLRLILSRIAEYVGAYQRQFAAYVAEEDYEQSARGQRRRVLRSDLLLLPPDAGGDWVQFRDVFEVDGRKVRDRADRLKKLFLENSAVGHRQLEAIQEESARYNLGEIRRNQNVPLYPMIFATADNIPRFAFKVAKKTTIDGLVAWRVEYSERVRPTFIKNPQGRDVPVHGAFTVDYATGAVMATEMIAEDSEMRGSVVVRYRRDEEQGLWLPAEMSEYYSERMAGVVSGYGRKPGLWVEARATYSNFRRFRVTTDTEFKGRK